MAKKKKKDTQKENIKENYYPILICLQLSNSTWPNSILLCDVGIAGVHPFRINPAKCDRKTDLH